ncbi:conserved oligomeric Golgi complex subunit 5 [Anoplophora glabripennis]|nr:conserved oligomeric Golgi complex subunit 5 [Anoplophora glabripennis]
MDRSEDDIIQRVENDDFYKYFLKSSSNAVLNYSMTITEQVKKLGEGIELLNLELQKQVLEKHNDLLQQAEHATKLETVLNIINTHVQNLFANAERLNSQITVPYNELEKHTKVLSRLHLASHILRQVNRLQQLSKRLSTTSDPVQKATILQELEQLACDPELSDIEAVNTELRNIKIHQQKLVQLSTGSLNQGILNENVTQTTTALQIFYNLGTIKTITNNLVQQNLDECRVCLQMALSANVGGNLAKNKGGPGRVALTSNQGFRSKIWIELEKLFSEDVYQICKQVKFLQITLSGLNMQNVEQNIAIMFWTKFGEILQEEIQKTTSAVQQMLEEDYPKLLKNYCEMTKKLKYDQFTFDRNVLKNLENSYLSTSLTRMLDPTQSLFDNESAVPSHDQIDSLIRIITSELSVALIEQNLNEQTSKNVAKCIKMFAVKTEQQLETGPEAAQVIGGSPNIGQNKNMNLANALYYLQTQIQRMLFNMRDSLPDSCVKIISESLQSLDYLTSSILQPLVGSITSVIETIIITLHLETDWPKLPLPANKTFQSCSPYMRELSQFIMRVYQTYLSNFENKEVLSAKCSDIAIRCIELFVRHTSLLRPISQGGRLRLQADYLHLENSLKVICPQLSDLGRPYRLLKSVASLIALSPTEIVSGQISGSSVPHSTILLMLFGFAGPELASPHQNTSWSLPKLSTWLDEHTNEEDRLDLIAGALQRYEHIVRQKNSVNYDPAYPVMSQFLETAIKGVKK